MDSGGAKRVGMQTENLKLTSVCRISPDSDSDGKIAEFTPADNYENAGGLCLNAYGQGPFCRFRIPDTSAELGNLKKAVGVYTLVDESGAVLYIGETIDLFRRFNAGYGQISPRNCYKGGQGPNCRINSKILSFLKDGHALWLLFGRLSDRKVARAIEGALIGECKPAWNINS